MSFSLLKSNRHDVYPFIDPNDALKGAATGKSVLVTGGGTGIGKAIAEAFALAGASKIVIAARRTEPLEKAKKAIAGLVPTCEVTAVGNIDITNVESVQKLFDSLPAPPDVLVSNAGGAAGLTTMAESDPAVWCKDVDLNTKGTYYVAHAYLRAVRAAGRNEGLIINISSNASWRYFAGLSAYSASKAAQNVLTESIDRENQATGSGVRCVAMHPGGVLTEAAVEAKAPDWILKLLIDTPALPGGTAVYLSTDRAKFLMGRFVSATWDMEELEKHRERIEKDDDMLRTRIVGLSESGE